MAGPWEKYQQQAASEKTGPWQKYAKPQAAAEANTGTFLPFSIDEHGNRSLAVPTAISGLFDAAKDAATLPGDVYTGKTDPLAAEGIARAANLAAFATPVNPAVRAGDRAIPGAARAMRKSVPKPPSTAELNKAGGALYKQAEKLPVKFKTEAVAKTAERIKQKLYDELAINKKSAPAVVGELDDIIREASEAAAQGGYADVKNIQQMRKVIRRLGQSNFTNPNERQAASIVRDELLNFMEKPDPGSVLAGPATEAGRLVRAADRNYSAAKRSELLDKAVDMVETGAAAVNSGKNIGNKFRQKANSLLFNEKAMQGFTEAERDSIRSVANGTMPANITRNVANMLGGGGGLGQTMLGGGTGALIGSSIIPGPIGAAAGAATGIAAGAGAKSLENAMSRNAFNAVQELIRSRSPLYEKMLRDAPMSVVSPMQRSALTRALLAKPADKQGGRVPPELERALLEAQSRGLKVF